MVQRANTMPQRDLFTPRETNWPPSERPFLDLSQTDGRFNAPPIHPRALSIEAALKNCVRLPIKEFALVVLLESGEEKTYTSQSLTPYQPRIFSDRFRQDFRRNLRRANAEVSFPAYSHDGMYGEFDSESRPNHQKQSSSEDSSSGRSRRNHQRQPRSDESDEDDPIKMKRRRIRGSLYPGQYSETSNDDHPAPVIAQKTQQLRIGDSAEVEKFYFVRFKDMQQSSCKVMGKAFVKLVEPKKQTHHPYTKGASRAPPWWPNTTGENHVRHREPDHLLKPERILLLVHILRMIVEPYEKQCPTVQKLALNVRKLEEVTMEAMSNWFNDKEHPENAAKRPFLKEIFKVAKAEERYKNGEIDGSTVIPVMYGDKPGMEGSDDEPEEGCKFEDDEHDINSATPASETLVSPSLMQNQHVQAQPETDPNGMFQRMRPLPVRYHTQPQLEEHPTYIDSYLPRSVGVGFQSQSPNIHDPIRRSFASPGYSSPQQNIYGWQHNNMVTNGPVPTNFYVTSPQGGLATQNSPYQLPPPNTQANMLPLPLAQHPFDGLSNGRQYDASPALGNQLRTGSLGHPHQMPQHHGFQDYLHDNSVFGSNDAELKEEQHMHQG